MVILDVWHQLFDSANPTQHRINIKQTLYPIVSMHHTVLVVEKSQFNSWHVTHILYYATLDEVIFTLGLVCKNAVEIIMALPKWLRSPGILVSVLTTIMHPFSVLILNSAKNRRYIVTT